ncbi:hypothetical protein [Runella sp.]|uniref:hypothetical protein n=1 Tax=Runella sp. TaxID=1960881 RepID=UPI003D111269
MPFSKKPWLVISFIIPVFLLAFVLYKNLLNIPFGDDIYVMDVFNLFKESGSWWEKLSVLFGQHNEHRLVVTRAVALLQYWLMGFIDVRIWSILGNLSLLFMVGLFYQHIGEQKWWIISIAFVIICTASNTLMPMQNSNLFTVVFGLATLHFVLKKTPKADFLTFLCTFLSIFSNSGGLALLIIVSGVLFFQKRYQLLALWLFYSGIIVVGYYWNYEPLYRHPSSELLFKQLSRAIIFFIAFAGSIGFKILPTGFLFIMLAGIALYRKYYLQNPFVFLVVIYCLMMAGMTTIKRYEYGIESAITERYRIYSMIFASCSLIMIHDFLSGYSATIQKTAFGIGLIAAIAVNLKFFIPMVRETEARKKLLISKIENYYLNNSGYNCFEVNILNKITNNNFYHYQLPEPLHDKTFYAGINHFPVKVIKLRINQAYQTGESLIIRGTIINPKPQLTYLDKIVHQFIILHPSDTPFDCSQNELTHPQNAKSVIVNIDLNNERMGMEFPDFFIKLPKKLFREKKYTLSFLFMTDISVNHPPLTSNVTFQL